MYAPSITVDQVIAALGAFIAPFAPGAQIVRGQVNRTPMPASPCVIITEHMQTDLSVPATDYDPVAGSATILGPTRFDVQIDFYGQPAGEFCQAARSAFRSQWGFDNFPAWLKPLYMSDGMQAPLTTGEQQYESRWTVTASLQYNPSVTVPQEFADVLTPGPLILADYQ